MSSWRYIAAKRHINEENHWTVQEIYESEGTTGWTDSPHGISPGGTSREELIRDLENMLSDMRNNEYVDLDTDKVENVLDYKREGENK